MSRQREVKARKERKKELCYNRSLYHSYCLIAIMKILAVELECC